MNQEKIKFHKAKKSFGQNFLKSVAALNKIVEAGEVNSNDTILEIGPGKGALTSKLLEKAGRVIAVEKDRDLIIILEDKFKEEIKKGKFILINQDILEFSVGDLNLLYANGLAERTREENRGPEQKNKFKSPLNYKVIANIPYNITGAILKKFLTEDPQPERMVLMVQNEVAKRIVANNEGESILSISVKAYGIPKIAMKVQKRFFSPSPKVDSAIIAINSINKDLFTKSKRTEGAKDRTIDESIFWEIIHAGFAHKRKVLINNLKSCARQDLAQDWKGVFSKLNLNEKIRAEELKVEDWVNIIKNIKLK